MTSPTEFQLVSLMNSISTSSLPSDNLARKTILPSEHPPASSLVSTWSYSTELLWHPPWILQDRSEHPESLPWKTNAQYLGTAPSASTTDHTYFTRPSNRQLQVSCICDTESRPHTIKAGCRRRHLCMRLTSNSAHWPRAAAS